MEHQINGHWEWGPVPGLLGCLYLENVTNKRLREDYFRAASRGALKFETNEYGTLVLKPYWIEDKTKENLEEKSKGERK